MEEGREATYLPFPVSMVPGPCPAAPALLTPQAQETLRKSSQTGSKEKAQKPADHLFWVKIK